MRQRKVKVKKKQKKRTMPTLVADRLSAEQFKRKKKNARIPQPSKHTKVHQKIALLSTSVPGHDKRRELSPPIE